MLSYLKFSKKKFFFLISLLINQFIFSEGFISGTLVQIKDDYKPIEQLKENDLVTSYNFKENILCIGKITKIKKIHYKTKVKLIIDGQEIVTAPDHKFYCPLNEKNHWKKAKDLQPGEKDGFEPKKKWDSKKKKHPETGQYGYPDKDGDLWVPTGEGGAAHGGPHWDIIDKDGRKIDDIFPGGKSRGDK